MNSLWTPQQKYEATKPTIADPEVAAAVHAKDEINKKHNQLQASLKISIYDAWLRVFPGYRSFKEMIVCPYLIHVVFLHVWNIRNIIKKLYEIIFSLTN